MYIMYINSFIFIVLLCSVRCDKSDTTDAAVSCKEISRKDIEDHLSTKTPYRVVANFNDKPKNYEGCRPVRLWSINRHGTRNPSKKVIKQAKTKLMAVKEGILAKGDVDLCPQQLERLSTWDFNVTAEEEKFLVAEGEDELVELAERMQNRFPTLLPDVYDPKMFYFKYTATQRTLKSAQSFATGLFGRHRIGEIIFPEPLHKDPVLRLLSPMYEAARLSQREHRFGVRAAFEGGLDKKLHIKLCHRVAQSLSGLCFPRSDLYFTQTLLES